MKINPMEITVRKLVKDYKDDGEGGVTGYSGRLDIRPPYQREFIYNAKQRDAVVDTISKGYPLNVMYWAVRPDGRFEIIDGQQRTISIAQYVTGDFSVGDLFDWRDKRQFHRLQEDEREKILDYKLHIYQCTGTNSDRLKWFERINIAGVKLTQQEIRNAVYYAPWLEEAKRIFSRNGCPASDVGKGYVKGRVDRQEYLERAIQWINRGDVVGYMNRQEGTENAPNGKKLWEHFVSVISWVNATFTEYRKEMEGVDWGDLYREFKDASLDPVEIEEKVAELMKQESVTSKKGVYEFVLKGDVKKLSVRAFKSEIKREAYERQKGICPECEDKSKFKMGEMEADHIKPWVEGGYTIPGNCQMICVPCHVRKTKRQLQGFWLSSVESE